MWAALCAMQAIPFEMAGINFAGPFSRGALLWAPRGRRGREMAQNGKHVAKSMAEKGWKVATRGYINSHPSTIERQEMLADAQRHCAAPRAGGVPPLCAGRRSAPTNLLDSGYNALHRAGAGGHTAAIARLLDRKANVALRDAQGGCTALHHAAFGSIHAVAALLQPNQKAFSTRRMITARRSNGMRAARARRYC